MSENKDREVTYQLLMLPKEMQLWETKLDLLPTNINIWVLIRLLAKKNIRNRCLHTYFPIPRLSFTPSLLALLSLLSSQSSSLNPFIMATTGMWGSWSQQQFLSAAYFFLFFPSPLIWILHELQSFWDYLLCHGVSPPPLALVFPLLFLATFFCSFLSLCFQYFQCFHNHIFTEASQTLLMDLVLALEPLLVSSTEQPQSSQRRESHSILQPLQALPCTCNSASSFSVSSGKIQVYGNLKVACEGKR